MGGSLNFFAVQFFGLSMSKNLYSSFIGFSVVVSLRILEHGISSFPYFHQENRTCNGGWLERRRVVLSVPNQDWEKYIQEQFLFLESVIISYIWIIFWSSVQIIIENNKLLVIIHGIWGRILSFLASTIGYPTDAINVLLNFDITIYSWRSFAPNRFFQNTTNGKEGLISFATPGADKLEHATPIQSLCNGIFTDWSIFSIPFFSK